MRRLLVIALVAILAAACSSSSKSASSSGTTSSSTTSTTAARALEILVTNDDGYDAPGIDAVVEAVRAMPGVHVTVVAPATNQSGTGDATTPGDLATHEVKTKSGYATVAVDGHPADAVLVALGKLALKPDIVVSGTNMGQNIGPLAAISGTVGAAKTAARHGIPAFASSTGLAQAPDFAGSAKLVVQWLTDHRAALLGHTAKVEVDNLNVPTCETGARRGLLPSIPLATDFKGRSASDSDCASTKPSTGFADDVDAFANGYAAISVVPFS